MEDVTVFVINGDKTEDGKSFLQQLKEDHPNVHIQYCEFGPVIASHLGSGGLDWVTSQEESTLINI